MKYFGYCRSFLIPHQHLLTTIQLYQQYLYKRLQQPSLHPPLTSLLPIFQYQTMIRPFQLERRHGRRWSQASELMVLRELSRKISRKGRRGETRKWWVGGERLRERRGERLDLGLDLPYRSVVLLECCCCWCCWGWNKFFSKSKSKVECPNFTRKASVGDLGIGTMIFFKLEIFPFFAFLPSSHFSFQVKFFSLRVLLAYIHCIFPFSRLFRTFTFVFISPLGVRPMICRFHRSFVCTLVWDRDQTIDTRWDDNHGTRIISL